MNFLYKVYARIYQFCFKLALPILPYRDPKIIDTISGIIPVLKDNNKKSILIVTDKNISSLGIMDNLLNELSTNNIKYVIYDDVVVNPTTLNCDSALKLYKDNSCDAIIAFGGGSPMDCAKGVGALVACPKKNLNDLKGILHVRKKIPLLIAVPTTAGTGSETTLSCVIVDSKTRHKYAINDFPLIPSYAVLDESVCMSLPKSIIATTGMDALTHAIESFIGKSGNKSTRNDALEAIKLIFDNLYESYLEPNKLARKNMLYAAHLAGRSFSKAYVGYVHALAHSLGGKYNTPHGLANAVILPIVLKEYGKSIYKKMKRIALYLGLCDKHTSALEATNVFINKIIDLNNLMNIPSYLDDILESDYKELASWAYKEANPLYPVPKLWSKKKMIDMYKIIGGNDERRAN